MHHTSAPRRQIDRHTAKNHVLNHHPRDKSPTLSHRENTLRHSVAARDLVLAFNACLYVSDYSPPGPTARHFFPAGATGSNRLRGFSSCGRQAK